jgi:pimeloyl-ACP methyl ester carboxylesterase
VIGMSDAGPSTTLGRQCQSRWAPLGFTTRSIAVNGVDLHVAEGGSGEPLLLLHGYPQSGECWQSVAPQLALGGRRVVIPDLRGMGLSGITLDGYELPELAEDVHRLVGHLGIAEVDVVGHDWGGAVAAVYALRHRTEVRRLAFIESAVGGAGFEDVWSFNRPNPAMTFIPLLLSDVLAEGLITGREEVYLHHLWDTFTANKTRATFDSWAPYLAALKRPGLISSGAKYYRAVYAAAEAVQRLIGAGKLTIPVLSVAGSASFGAGQRALVDAFADNVVNDVVIDDAGHFIPEEQPDALLAALDDFLEPAS